MHPGEVHSLEPMFALELGKTDIFEQNQAASGLRPICCSDGEMGSCPGLVGTQAAVWARARSKAFLDLVEGV